MTKHGTLNLAAMFLLPVAAVIAGFIATLNGVWNAYSATYIAVFSTTIAVTLPAAFFSWLFLRRSTGETARLIAIMPCLFPAVLGSVWYLWYALFPAEIAAGAEYLGFPQYLLLIMLGTTFLVLLLRLLRIAPRHS